MTAVEEQVRVEIPATEGGVHVQRLRSEGCCDKGWRQVTDEYAHRHAAMSHEGRPSVYDPDRNRSDYERFIAFRETYLPCNRHNPALHQRWADGHLNPNHHCEECKR